MYVLRDHRADRGTAPWTFAGGIGWAFLSSFLGPGLSESCLHPSVWRLPPLFLVLSCLVLP